MTYKQRMKLLNLADILEDEDYSPEQRAHQIVWQALKWMMENPVQKGEQK